MKKRWFSVYNRRVYIAMMIMIIYAIACCWFFTWMGAVDYLVSIIVGVATGFITGIGMMMIDMEDRDDEFAAGLKHRLLQVKFLLERLEALNNAVENSAGDSYYSSRAAVLSDRLLEKVNALAIEDRGILKKYGVTGLLDEYLYSGDWTEIAATEDEWLHALAASGERRKKRDRKKTAADHQRRKLELLMEERLSAMVPVLAALSSK